MSLPSLVFKRQAPSPPSNLFGAHLRSTFGSPSISPRRSSPLPELSLLGLGPGSPAGEARAGLPPRGELRMSRPVSPPRGLPSTSSIGLFPASRGRRDSMLLPPDGRAGPGRGPGGPLPEEEPPRRPPGGRTRPSSTKALLVTGVAWSDMAEDTLDRAGVEVLCFSDEGENRGEVRF